MNWTQAVRQAFPADRVPEDEVIEELAQHAAAAFDAARADGCSEDEARGRVDAQLAAWANDPGALARRPRRKPVIEPPPAVEGSRFAGLGRDARYAVQTIVRQPTMAALVALTLALGVGATTLLFSVAYGVLLKPMPWPGAERLVRLTETRQGSTRKPAFFTNVTYLAWAEHPQTIEAIGAWATAPITIAGAGEPERVRGVEATPSLFAMLGTKPALGGLFATDAAGFADEAQVIISHVLWMRKFGGAGNVIGRPLTVDGAPCRIVGVAPRGFAFPDPEVQIYVPFNVPPVGGKNGQGGTMSMFAAMARLKPGVTPAQAASEATARGRGAADPGLVTMAVFGSRGPVQAFAVPWLESVVGEVRPAVVIFLVAVGLLLAVATANIASLQLARATARRREFAVRSALGAGTGRLTRQLLVENLVIGQVGGLLGLAVSAVLLRVLPSLAPADFPRLADIGLDWRAAVVALGVSLVASVAFGLAPVLQARRLDVSAALAEDGLAPVGGHARSKTARTRLMIMAGQVAATSVLLVGAFLLGRSFLALLNADRGYDPSNVLTAVVSLPDGATPAARRDVVEQVIQRLRAVSGVTVASYATRIPLVSGGDVLSAFPVPARSGGGTVSAHASLRYVGPGFFEAMGLRVREGRGFRDSDSAATQEVVVVNRAFAREYLDAPAVGKRLPRQNGFTEVIGVIDDVTYGPTADPAQPEVYHAGRQADSGFGFDQTTLIVRTRQRPADLVPSLRAIVREQGQGLALGSIMTMEDRVWASLARPRLYAVLLAGFAAFALAVAGVGLFGVLSYSVSLRAREIGVRTTLGATPARIVLLVGRQTIVVTVIGLVIGLGAAAALGRSLTGLLYGVQPTDGLTFGLVGAVVAVVAVLASVAPARRAAQVDPVRVLR